MARRHTVRFEPVDLEIEVSEDETVLEGAFRQGVMLMHGCKEGQCSACKSFLISGEVDLERYSTFALADYEREEGYTLLCRAHAFSDLEVELLHFDEEVLTSSVPIQTVRTEVASITALTHDIRHLVLNLLDPREIDFHAGQYVDVQIPGTTHTRAFSMANTPATGGRLEFMIKLYPGGRFSGLLEEQLAPGHELAVRGPYGVFILREHSDADLIFIGGGAGMAPIWSLLNSMSERGIRRKVTYYYGARSPRDLFHLDELARLGEHLPDFRFVPALSEPAPGDQWEGETGLITDVVDRLETDLSGHEGYLCGPPPMIDAAIELLVAKGIGEARIFYDKFTITASEEEQAGHQT
ncbi:MAG TPA: FAD-binding oxidoreductase [Baekduia sp.]|uniref:NADH:ubiquinone reductase (Na(+)-transporting) subunit F n=1 Tax=Baekduia sp. TaxID=2600305 RepID=UPI002D0AB424|nr:FAD-binding oxidoreductase [Baekduia sp.]HMJ37336.1 FAD-binding oxidoreductase [Baekduia sp.]